MINDTSIKKISNTVVIFSHGFGVFKDDHGLFTDIEDVLKNHNIKTILFDYNKFNETTKEMEAIPFSKQSEILQKVIDDTLNNEKNADIIIIGHSQGCIIPTLCNLKGISKIIGTAPFFHTEMGEILKRHTSNPESVISFTELSKRKRSDGTITLIPPEYWKERFNTDVIRLYNETALKVDLTLIIALQDEIMNYTELKKVKYARIINTDGDHSFSKQYRSVLIDLILKEII